jgi:diguanylate cyclase (GGDEF)-like protein/PAS domain S-box-containing protein
MTGQAHATYRLRHHDGTWRWCDTDVQRALPGGPAALVLTAYDITERNRADAALRASEAHLAALFAHAEVGLSEIALDGRFLRVNATLSRILGRASDEVLRLTVADVTHADDRPASQAAVARVIATGAPLAFDKRYVQPDGTIVWANSTLSLLPMTNQQPPRILAVTADITTRKQAEAQLRYHAAHDALTGLPNRAAFLDHLRRALARHARHPDDGFAVLFLDLDRFKVINDSLGHHIGDQLLVQVAARLQQCVRPDDVVARLGGDEFTILVARVGGVADARAVAQRIHAAIATPVVLDGHEVTTTTSIGITLSDRRYAQPEEMLRDADTAMYKAKRHGAGREAVFDRTMHARAVARLHVETELQRAVERHEFRLHYQPIVELTTGAIRGVEALLRWQHPTRGLLGPRAFMMVAEETGVIVPLGQWVLRTACQQLRHWHLRFPTIAPWTMSVNVSGVQCQQPDLVAHVAQILHDTELAPHFLDLEITESVVLAHTGTAFALLHKLRALGVTLTLDDFGTGYSSLSYLHRFPMSTLKIDRSFISTPDTGRAQGALVRTIIALAQNMDLSVVAEGIETAAQRDHLAALQCRYGQGYLWGRPMDAAAVGQWLGRIG